MSTLRQAFEQTRFLVFEPSLELRIGVHNPALDAWLKARNLTEWAYITAWNPFAKTLTDAENAKRHAALQERVASFLHVEGEGVGTDPTWQPERSLLIAGITRAEAMQIGRDVEQYAIVCGRLGEAPELVDLFDY